MDALVQQLDSYSRLGIPKLQHCNVKFEAEDAVEEGKLCNLYVLKIEFIHLLFCFTLRVKHVKKREKIYTLRYIVILCMRIL